MTKGYSTLKKTEETFVEDLLDDYLSLHESKQVSLELLEEQNCLLVHLLLDLTVESVEHNLVLNIVNRSTHVDFKVEAISVNSYNTDGKNVKSFFKQHGPDAPASSKDFVGSAHYLCHIRHMVLPQRKALRIPFIPQIEANCIHISVELTDTRGYTHYLSNWFFNDNQLSRTVLKRGSLYSLKSIQRLE